MTTEVWVFLGLYAVLIIGLFLLNQWGKKKR